MIFDKTSRRLIHEAQSIVISKIITNAAFVMFLVIHDKKNSSQDSCSEALACREAVALSRDFLLRKILVACDCLLVIKNLNEG
jgi:hypothetical protein